MKQRLGKAVVVKNFVHFFSPGTFVSEESVKEIDSWDVDQAVEMSKSITERHGAKPFAFSFSRRVNDGTELDSKETVRSGYYYLGGEVLTLEGIIARNDPEDETLIWSMKTNGYDRVIVNRKSYVSTMPLMDSDTVLDMSKYE